MFLERKSAGGWDEQGRPPTGAVPRRTASWQGCSHCDVAVAGTALRLQPPWEDILAQRLTLQVRPPLCDSPGRPAVIEASIQRTSQQEGHHNSIYFRTFRRSLFNTRSPFLNRPLRYYINCIGPLRSHPVKTRFSRQHSIFATTRKTHVPPQGT